MYVRNYMDKKRSAVKQLELKAGQAIVFPRHFSLSYELSLHTYKDQVTQYVVMHTIGKLLCWTATFHHLTVS